MNHIHRVVLLLCGLFLSQPLFGQSPPGGDKDKIYVGFLDDAREEMVDWKPGVARQRIIRPAFEKTSLGWKATDYTFLPPRMNWTIAFDGRSLGDVETGGSDEGLTGFLAVLTSAKNIPSVGSPSQEFAGLLANGPTKTRRPLVAVSKPNFADPDGWKRTNELPHETAALVRKEFRGEYSHVVRCKEEEIAERNWKFPDSALTFPIAYSSNKNSFLIEVSLNAGDCGYVDDPDDPLSEPWFFVSADRSIRRIGSFMSLLDAGDYDNDGKSELVFFISQGENTDGFALFDANLKKQATLVWHYH